MKKLKKNLANILTMIRIAISLYLLSFSSITKQYLLFFGFAGLTDVLDGPIARKTKSVSLLGSQLDTIADLVMFSSIIKIYIKLRLLKKRHWMMIIAGVIMLVSSLVIGFVKFKKLVFIHTISGKLLGFCTFLLPYAYVANVSGVMTTIACILLVITTFESLVIQIKSSEPMPNAKSMFSV